jgi:hypothetical protein
LTHIRAVPDFTLPGGEHRHRRVIRVNQVAAQHLLHDLVIERLQQLGEMAHGRAKNLSDSIGFFDKNDFYRVRLTKRSILNIKLADLSDRADLRVYNGANVIVGESRRGGASNEYLSLDLASGWYYVRVFDRGGIGSTYSLRVAADALPVASTPPPATPSTDPGNDFGTAKPLGTLRAARPIDLVNSVAPADRNDFFVLTTTASGKLTLSLAGLAANADLRLFDGSRRLVFESVRPGASTEAIERVVAAGTYYVQVLSRTQTPTNYALRVAWT